MALSAAMTVAQRSSLVAHWRRPLHRAVPNGAGHNRWSKVRHIKGQRDGQRAALIQRLCARLRAAAMDGGPDPAVNAALAQAVAQCRASNVPKASIMAAISAAKPQCSERRLLAVRGPGGSRIVVVYDGREGALLSCVKRLLHREGASLSEVPRGAFEERGWIRTAPHSAAGCPIGQEGALSAAIAAGAEDVNLDGKPGDGDGEEALEFLCPPSELSAVGQRLQQEGLRLLASGVRLVPHRRVALQAEERRRAERLLKELRRCPGVSDVVHNIEGPEVGEGEPEVGG